MFLTSCLLLGIKDGEYSLRFANDETVRVYFYSKIFATVSGNRSETDLLNSNQNSILFRPNFQRFLNCLRMSFEQEYDKESMVKYRKKNQNHSQANILAPRYTSEDHWQGIKCQACNETISAQIHSTLEKMSLIHRRSMECTWEYVLDGTKEAGGMFNVTWEEPQYPLPQPFDKTFLLTKTEGNGTAMALTCTPFPYSCLRENLRGEKCGVTFAIPFILRQKIYSIKESTSCRELLLRQSTTITILSCLVSFLGLVAVGLIIYLLFSQKR